ncbi:MAG: HNH endonuclease, partial [Nanoarchaeota archaeon]
GEPKRKLLQADHIKSWALFPLLRFTVDNGQILCIKCHRFKTRFIDTFVFQHPMHSEDIETTWYQYL